MTARPERLEDVQDEDLMADVAAGDRRAFEVLMRRHLKRAIALADRFVGDAGDAEDVVQDAFLRLWNHAETWRPGRGRFTTWFYRILVNRCYELRRRIRPPMVDEAEIDLVSPLPGADAAVHERQLAREAEAALQALPERQRAALALCFYEDLSCQEAASVMRVSVPAMESLLVRARRSVRERLKNIMTPDGGGQP
jgi:RNA polymerase sigma-70 factor, ECF subfamily